MEINPELSMKVEKIEHPRSTSHVLRGEAVQSAQMKDNRKSVLIQAKLMDAIQRQEEDEEELIQGKFENKTGIPDDVKQRMEDSFGTDFSSVRVHPESSKAPEVGALAYTQGTDIHFAPGQFKPETSTGQQLLGHELTHVIQQSEGRVQPTTEIGGMAVNDDISLENEADLLGAKASM